MSVDISGASDQAAVLTAAAPPEPDPEVLASRQLVTGRFGNLLANLAQLARRPVFLIAFLYVPFGCVA